MRGSGCTESSAARARSRGAIGLEFAGILVVAALVVSLVVVAVAQDNAIGRAVKAAVCQIFTLGQGSCDAGGGEASRLPTEPCVVASDGYAVSGDISVTFVTVGGNVATTIEELSNGQYRVSMTSGGKAGLTAGIGIGGTVEVNDGRYGAEADAGAEATLGTAVTDIYYVGSREAAEAIRDWAVYDQTMDAAVGSQSTNPVVSVFSWAVRPVTDWGAGLAGVDNPGPPDSVEYEGGVSASASANLTGLVVGVEAQASGATVMGLRVNPDGTQTVFGRLEGSVGITGSALQGAAGPTGTGQVGFERTSDADGNLTSVTYNLLHETDNGYAVESYTLPIRSDADRAAADVLLTDPRPWEWGQFTDQAKARGEATTVAYDTDGLGIGAGGTISVAAELGANGSFSMPTAEVVDAQYFDGSGWQPWTQCVGG